MDSLSKHKMKHKAEKKTNSQNSFQGSTYKFKCTKCRVSFKSHDDMMNHLSEVHLTESQRQGAGLSKYISSDRDSKCEDRPQTCYNGDECRFHRQHRCNFFHPLPAQKRHVRRPRLTPSSQWQSFHSQHSSDQAAQQQQEHQDWAASRYTSLTWCKHQNNCLQGRFCALRQEEEQGFSRQPHQGWN